MSTPMPAPLAASIQLAQPAQSKEEPKDANIEPRKGLSFDLWESRYGRPLTELERHEIKTNLSEFFTLLLTENGRTK